MGLILWSLFGGVGGCSGGNVEEQDQPSHLTGPVRLVSIYPTGGPVGTIVSVCATGSVSETIIQFCEQPVTLPPAPETLRFEIDDDSAYTGCGEEGSEILFPVPEGCPVGEVTVKAVAGTEASNEIPFEVTVPPPDQDQGGDTRARQGDTGGTTTGGTTTGGSTTGGTTTGGTTTGSRRITPDPIVNPDPDCPTEKTCEHPTPVCNTATGDCVKCLPSHNDPNNFNMNTECLDPEMRGPGATCNDDNECVEIECATAAHCAARSGHGDLTVDCGTDHQGCYCDLTDLKCEPYRAAPTNPLIFYAEKDERSPDDEGSLNRVLEDDLKTTQHENRLVDGSLHIKTEQATQAYIYGNFPIEAFMSWIIPVNSVFYEEADQETREAVDDLHGVWMEFLGITIEDHPDLRFLMKPLLFNDDADRTARQVDQGKLVECWPYDRNGQEIREGDPHYCKDLREHFDYLYDEDLSYSSLALTRRVYRYNLPVNEAVKFLFRFQKQKHTFVAVVYYDQAGRREPIPPSVVKIDVLNDPPVVTRCEVDPLSDAPFVRVTTSVTGALSAGIEAQYVGPRNAAMYWSGDLPLTKGFATDSLGNSGDKYFYVPVKNRHLKIHCHANGFGETTTPARVALAVNVVVGRQGGQAIGIDLSDGNDLEFSQHTLGETPPAGQESCTNASLFSYDYMKDHPDDENYPRLGQCKAKVLLQFSQQMRITTTTLDSRFQPSPISQHDPSRHCDDPNTPCLFPFAGEILFYAYKHDRAYEEHREVLRGERASSSNKECIYRFVAREHTNVPILESRPPRVLSDAFSRRQGCNNDNFDITDPPEADPPEEVPTAVNLSGGIVWNRDHGGNNYLAVAVRQFGDPRAGLDTMVGVSGRNPTIRKLDLRYYPRLEIEKVEEGSGCDAERDQEFYPLQRASQTCTAKFRFRGQHLAQAISESNIKVEAWGIRWETVEGYPIATQGWIDTDLGGSADYAYDDGGDWSCVGGCPSRGDVSPRELQESLGSVDVIVVDGGRDYKMINEGGDPEGWHDITISGAKFRSYRVTLDKRGDDGTDYSDVKKRNSTSGANCYMYHGSTTYGTGPETGELIRKHIHCFTPMYPMDVLPPPMFPCIPGIYDYCADWAPGTVCHNFDDNGIPTPGHGACLPFNYTIRDGFRRLWD